MYCKQDIQTCFDEINAYCSGMPTGKALLVNTENYTTYQNLKMKLEADNNKEKVYVSNCCAENGLPDLDDILDKVTGKGDYVLVGYSQAGMLRGASFLERQIGKLLEIPVSGHTIILLEHCEQFIKKYYSVHPDIQKRVVLVEGEKSALPKIRLAVSQTECIGFDPIQSMKRLFAYFEKLTDDMVVKDPEIAVLTSFSPALFKEALFSVASCDNIYVALQKKYPEMLAGTKQQYGTESQWRYLAEKLQKSRTLSSLANRLFGSTDNLPSQLAEVIDEGDEDKKWLLWLLMKVFNNTNNKYVQVVMRNSMSLNDFEEHVYLDILNIQKDDEAFRQYYMERKRLLEVLPENIVMLDLFCSKLGIYQRNSIYYLTDLSDKEELYFMQCLAKYDYTKDELLKITDGTFPLIYYYLQRFVFNATNTRVPTDDIELRDMLTEYFEQYKIQKLTNRIYPDFLSEVQKIAIERPYNKLQARSTIVKKMDKTSSQLYFFDALGVEYLGYIQSICEKYGLIAEITVGHCELPSITEKNKEFLNYFTEGALDIKELDELKHHNQIIDYEQCKEPVHLFKELQIIDGELRKIQSRLTQGPCEKAIIVSDHGASRLAVIFEQENEKLELEEKGKHSGRCCPVKEDPQIPYATYWDGYAVLANYERFKGGRKANVEVHGGATLEEVVVPVIVLTKKPKDIEICFVNPVVTIKGKVPATITVYSNIPLQEPKLIVNNKTYIGEFCEDSKHAKFTMPEMRRTRDWTADFYDGKRRLASNMEFRVQKSTQEQMLFKKDIF